MRSPLNYETRRKGVLQVVEAPAGSTVGGDDGDVVAMQLRLEQPDHAWPMALSTRPRLCRWPGCADVVRQFRVGMEVYGRVPELPQHNISTVKEVR